MQNCARIVDEYASCWELLKSYFPGVPETTLAASDPMIAFIALNAEMLRAIIHETTPEDAAVTDQQLDLMSAFMASFRGQMIKGTQGGAVQ